MKEETQAVSINIKDPDDVLFHDFGGRKDNECIRHRWA
jgi:hypothetical protein